MTSKGSQKGRGWVPTSWWCCVCVCVLFFGGWNWGHSGCDCHYFGEVFFRNVWHSGRLRGSEIAMATKWEWPETHQNRGVACTLHPHGKGMMGAGSCEFLKRYRVRLSSKILGAHVPGCTMGYGGSRTRHAGPGQREAPGPLSERHGFYGAQESHPDWLTTLVWSRSSQVPSIGTDGEPTRSPRHQL